MEANNGCQDRLTKVVPVLRICRPRNAMSPTRTINPHWLSASHLCEPNRDIGWRPLGAACPTSTA